MIYHVYSHYTPKNPETKRRMALAKRTWETQPWSERPVGDHQCRIFKDSSGGIPYIHDILDAGMEGVEDADIVVLTNSDICVANRCCFTIVGALQSVSAVYCFRRDFGRLNTPLPDPIISRGTHYCGSDFYAFRAGWWRKYGEDFPDMLIGREGWDALLRIMMEQTQPGQNPTVYDLIYHEKHASVWENPRNRHRLPSQQHNIALAKTWLRSYGFDPRSVGIT